MSLAIGLLVSVACSSGSGSVASRDPSPRRNIVVFSSDALRASSLRLYGYPIATTPRLDAFARTGTVFSRHLAHHPATPGSVSQMMTGRLMSPWLLETRPAVAEAKDLPDDMRVLPDVLRQAGYLTGLVTTHYPFFNRARLRESFDYDVVIEPPPDRAWADVDALTPAVWSFLDSAARQRSPFFLYVHAMDTHSPLHGWRRTPPPNLRKARRYAAYDARIVDVDTWFGSLLDELARLGLEETTVVAFTSDHGDDHGEEGREIWDRGHGFTIRESQLHVPLVVRVPDDPQPGRVYDGTTAHVDVAPTLLSLAAVPPAVSDLSVDGVDLSPFWFEGVQVTSPDRPVLAFNHRYWGLFVGRRLVRFDAWGGHLSEFAFLPNALNYPRPTEVDLSPGDVAAQLIEERQKRVAEYWGFPLVARMMDRERVGVPTWIETADMTAPTYARDPSDNRWTVNAWMLLECSPEEECPPLELATPWVPGRYRLQIRLATDEAYASFRNRLVVQVQGQGGEARSVEVRPKGSALSDLGVHVLGDALRVRVSRPEGGVAVRGFELERQGAPGDLPSDLAVHEERLRALGYLQ